MNAVKTKKIHEQVENKNNTCSVWKQERYTWPVKTKMMHELNESKSTTKQKLYMNRMKTTIVHTQGGNKQDQYKSRQSEASQGLKRVDE